MFQVIESKSIKHIDFKYLPTETQDTWASYRASNRDHWASDWKDWNEVKH
jgi:hypothetical protein